MPPPAPDPVFVTPGVLRGWPLPRPGAGKEQRGRVLVVGGSAETPGAALLAALAALRTGAGKLQIATVLAAKVGRLGFLARELVAEIPTVLSELEA